ncbi:MAG: DUF1064 domain-containing protein [bacterium]|nr:DUF1064 domain-containing protein [bacterium]
MNGLEARYAAHLEALRVAGQIIDWRFEPITLRLAARTRYTPDFFVIFPTGLIRIVEVKGHWRDDARVKFKVAAELYWWFEFVAVTAKKKADGGGWNTERINSMSLDAIGGRP